MTDSNSRRPIPPHPSSVHAQRRASGGPRQAASERVSLRNASGSFTGWTLNVSRGGARLVVEEPMVVGQTWDLLTGEKETVRPIRVVWVRDESGGQIVGVEYLDAMGTVPPNDEPSENT